MNQQNQPAEHEPVRILQADGTFAPNAAAEPFLARLDALSDADHARFYRDMVSVRAFDREATNLQRQGEMALYPPSHGQEAAQVGSARAARPQDHIFPSYREHVVGMIRGIDPLDIIRLMRGVTHGGWNPNDPKNGNFHLYTLVLGSQTLHATGYAMGQVLDGATGTGNPETDQATMVYFGDGSSSEGDVNEALVFAASYQTPQVFFLQNNHWAISVPVSIQSRTPLFRRGEGFGINSIQIDGNDVLASYAVSADRLDAARAGGGPRFIEALTYRVGAHTTSDDPTKYRSEEELASWVARDPIIRFEKYLRARGAEESVFTGAEEEARDLAADIRRRTLEIADPAVEKIFEHVYTDPHPQMEEQLAWLTEYEAGMNAAGEAEETR
ncbi:thiamine pyrophosphate-dependent dehydrogenase E1 component subunit alpha [Mycetocola spongiae]|uniref:thiamine pyrophosphate-dependent dehydrogenase E1 component subunit alpha n=1 Tax=Mycetocola spongiae TaxID=2859226 RepID=UPI001CF4CB3E|nr:thiamine pyrophosphate-dependent dehydrogenase E1 component subunit alpha [Mycetocola spongiae]UCR88294.1 thiamine pyrophosphate-dependent dehydrogenase E1 component subunit alpha [Mycetocola spongiae]